MRTSRSCAAAAWALWRVSRNLKASVPVLVECLSSRCPVVSGDPGATQPDENVRRVAAAALFEIAQSGAASKEIVEDAVGKAPPDAAAPYRGAKKNLMDEVGAEIRYPLPTFGRTE